MPYRPTERTRARLAAARERIVDAALEQLADGGYASSPACRPSSSNRLEPMSTLTHDVLNQSVPFEDVNLFELDLALREALEREGAGWAVDRARDTGAVAGPAPAAAPRRPPGGKEPGVPAPPPLRRP